MRVQPSRPNQKPNNKSHKTNNPLPNCSHRPALPNPSASNSSSSHSPPSHQCPPLSPLPLCHPQRNLCKAHPGRLNLLPVYHLKIWLQVACWWRVWALGLTQESRHTLEEELWGQWWAVVRVQLEELTLFN